MSGTFLGGCASVSVSSGIAEPPPSPSQRGTRPGQTAGFSSHIIFVGRPNLNFMTAFLFDQACPQRNSYSCKEFFLAPRGSLEREGGRVRGEGVKRAPTTATTGAAWWYVTTF